MNYIALKAGDIRQAKDEVTRLEVGVNNIGLYDSNRWLPVRLLGHAILASDLIILSFRRPL